MKKRTQTENEKNANKWLKLVVVPTIFPVTLSYIADIIIGYDSYQILSRHILEIILVIFAIVVSIFGSILNKMKTSKNISQDYIINSVGCGIFCMAFYCILYDRVSKFSFFILLLLHILFIIITGLTIKNGYKLEKET